MFGLIRPRCEHSRHGGGWWENWEIGRFGLGSDAARPRPEDSVAPYGVEEGFEGGDFIGGDISGIYMAGLVETVVEAVPCNVPAWAHLCLSLPHNAFVDVFVSEV